MIIIGIMKSKEFKWLNQVTQVVIGRAGTLDNLSKVQTSTFFFNALGVYLYSSQNALTLAGEKMLCMRSLKNDKAYSQV